MKATLRTGQLVPIENCWVFIPGAGKIILNVLPDISDQKSANYADEAIIGRANPMKTYSHSENRAISITFHFFVTQQADVHLNLKYLRWIESAVYPRDGYTGLGVPFVPPPVCKIKCGSLLASEALCAVLKSYSVKFPTNVVWDKNTFIPYKFDVTTSWDVVYRSKDLPGQELIVRTGGGQRNKTTQSIVDAAVERIASNRATGQFEAPR